MKSYENPLAYECDLKAERDLLKEQLEFLLEALELAEAALTIAAGSPGLSNAGYIAGLNLMSRARISARAAIAKAKP